MDLSTLLLAVLRRWYVSVTVLGLAALFAYGLYAQATPQYSSSTSVVVLPSPSLLQVRANAQAGESSLGNPFGASATGVLARLLADQINNGGVTLTGEAAGASVAVATGGQTVESWFTVQAVGPTPEATAAALAAVADQGPGLLAQIQVTAGSPADQLYTSVRTRSLTGMSVGYPDRLRTSLGILVAGVLLAGILSTLVDSLIRSAQARKAEGSGPGATVLDETTGEERPRVGLRRRRSPLEQGST